MGMAPRLGAQRELSALCGAEGGGDAFAAVVMASSMTVLVAVMVKDMVMGTVLVPHT